MRRASISAAVVCLAVSTAVALVVLGTKYPGGIFAKVYAQEPAQVSATPLVGTWNLTATFPAAPPALVVMTFNLGGTTVEFNTSGTNSSASPGQSIALGKWRSNTDAGYTFNEENVIYDASGNLAFIAIATVDVTLASTLKSLTGNGVVNFYNCSVSLCPGSLVATSPVQVAGTRF